jgi:hypothetical protein
MTIRNGSPAPEGTAIDLSDWSRRIQTRADFSDFVCALAVNMRQNPGAVANADLSSFLEALGAWAADMDGYFKNRGESLPEQPTWAVFAQMLLAARSYE